MVLYDVYKQLRQYGLVDSESEFSKDWLCRSDSYMRSMRFRNTAPSISSVAVCASRLRYYADMMASSEAHKSLSMSFIEMANRCDSFINKSALSVWQQSSKLVL